MALKLQFTFTEGTTLETVVVDASVSETHTFGAQVTDYPVEKGAAVSDNIRATPVTLRVEAFISDFPLLNDGRGQASSGGVQGSQRPSARTETSKQILQKLRALQEQGVILTVDTGLKKYENMALVSIDVPRDKSLKNGLRVNLSLKEIRIVETQMVNIQKPKEPKGQGKTKGGPQTKKPADPATEEKKQSLAARFADSLSKSLPK